MRALVLALALAGCRQVLGIPGEGEFDEASAPRFDVTIEPRGIVGASVATAIDITTSDGAIEHVDLTTDEPVTIAVRDGLGYTVATTTPSICMIENASGTVRGRAPPLAVTITCDGVAALADAGFSAPVTLAFASSGSTFDVLASFLVQETALHPAPMQAAASLVVEVDGAAQTPTNGTWGPFPYSPDAGVVMTASYAPFVRTYNFTTADAQPAPFGYGKAAMPVAGSRFGAAVAADGDVVAVGAPGPADASEPGRVYVFRRAGTRWTEEAVLQAPVPAAGDSFGASVAVRGQRIVVGAPDAVSASARAFVFVYAGAGMWSRTAVTAPPGDGNGFGFAVALEADHILIGAPRTNSSTGAVYRFNFDGTGPTVFGEGVDPGDRFGASIAAHAGTVVIGAPGEASSGASPTDNTYPDAGAAYIYAGGSPVYLKATAPAAGDQLGTAVATNGDVVVVGAPYEDSSAPFSSGIDPTGMLTGGAPQSGAVYMWRNESSTWTFVHVLKAPNTGTGDGFGSSLAFVRDVLAIGAPFEDSASLELLTANENRRDAGAAYAYRLLLDDVSDMPSYLKAPTPGIDDAFGSAVALTLESLLVGAPYDNSAASGWGGTGGDVGVDTGAITSYR